MIRGFVLLCALAVLSGCLAPTTPSGSSGNDGVAAKLSSGITEAEAGVALGVEAGLERNPENWDESCLSYAYGDSPLRYVHAVFRKGVLVRATDGHREICTYGTLASG